MSFSNGLLYKYGTVGMGMGSSFRVRLWMLAWLLMPLSAHTADKKAAPPTAALASDSTTEIRRVYDRVAPSVVIVRASLAEKGDSQGSAVAYLNGCAMKREAKTCIPASTWFFTNAHVVGDAESVTLSASGTSFQAKVDYRDADRDIALLFADTTILPVVEVDEVPHVSIGDRVYAVGAPKGLERTITDGIVSAIRTGGVIQTSAPISPGSSGGGLFNSSGRLVGLTTSKVVDGEALNFAIPVTGYTEIERARASAVTLMALFDFDKPGVRDSLRRWLLVAPGSSHKKRFQLLDDWYNQWLTGEMDKDQFVSAMEIAFKQFSKDTSYVGQSLAGSGTRDSTVTRLVCEMGTRSLEPRAKTVTVDFSNKIVDGFPATITEEQITWTISSGSRLVIDRFAGTIRMEGTDLRGRCKKAGTQSF